MKKFIIKTFPYLISIIFAILFSYIGFNQTIDYLKSLCMSISATLLGIPIVFLFFDVAKSISERKLSKNVFGYIKMQTDTLLLELMNRAVKLIYPYESPQTSTETINSALNLTKESLSNFLKNNKHIGFTFQNDLKVFEEKFRSHLNFALSTNYLNVDMLHALTEIGKSIRSFIYYSENTKNLFLVHNNTANYTIINASELDKNNPDNTYLLMETLNKNESKVVDSGIFTQNKIKSLLNYHDINPKHLPQYTDELFQLLKNIKKWLKTTGHEFILDTRQFKLTY